MKRGFIIILEIVILVAFLQTAFAKYLLEDVQKEVASWFSAASDYAEEQQLTELREKIQPHVVSLNDRQQAYIHELTKDKERMRQFSANYCKGSDKNPYVYGPTLIEVCRHINSSKVLFPAVKT